jgi:hypothetical protein
MNEFEILQNAQNSFQQNAAYLLVVTILVCLNFYLIRRARELNMPAYGKIMTTIFGLMTINFGWTVGTFLRGTQNDMAFRLSELKSKGTEISAASESWIEFMGNPTSPAMASSPDLSTMLFWGLLALMLVAGMWAPVPEGTYEK